MDYKVSYFNIRVLGEPVRWMLLAANQPFEDDRVNPEDWPQRKQELLWGQMPVLTFDGGKQLTQSVAITEFLGRKFNFVPFDEVEKARCVEIVGHINDCRVKWAAWYLEADLEKREEIRKDQLANLFPSYLSKFNDIVAANGGNYVVGKKTTWADFWLANFLEIWVDNMNPNLLDPYPALQKQMACVLSIPQIKNWIKIRPKGMLFGVAI